MKGYRLRGEFLIDLTRKSHLIFSPEFFTDNIRNHNYKKALEIKPVFMRQNKENSILSQINVTPFVDVMLVLLVVFMIVALISVRPGFSSGESVRDLQIIRGFLTSQGLFAFFDAPWSILYLAVIFMINSVIGFVALFGIQQQISR